MFRDSTDSLPQQPPATRPRPAIRTAGGGYFPLFDGLRIVLALAVVLHHEGVFGWRNAGNLAVQVFFSLSGWLIGGILLGTSREGLARFWFNRATRIWIPYLSALALLLSVALARDRVTPTWLRTAFHYATFTYNWFGYAPVEAGHAIASAMPLRGSGHPLWSICAEEQFYLVAPLVLVLAPRWLGRSRSAWVLLSLAAVVGDVYGSISLGVLAAVVRTRHGDWHLTRAGTAALGATGLGAAAALLAGAPYHLAAPFFSVSLVLLLAREGARSRLGAFLGGVSYPLYLNQWIAILAANVLLRRSGIHWPGVEPALACVLALGVSAVMFKAVDEQSMKRRGRWFTRPIGWTVATVGFVAVGIGLVLGIAWGPIAS